MKKNNLFKGPLFLGYFWHFNCHKFCFILTQVAKLQFSENIWMSYNSPKRISVRQTSTKKTPLKYFFKKLFFHERSSAKTKKFQILMKKIGKGILLPRKSSKPIHFLWNYGFSNFLFHFIAILIFKMTTLLNFLQSCSHKWVLLSRYFSTSGSTSQVIVVMFLRNMG